MEEGNQSLRPSTSLTASLRPSAAGEFSAGWSAERYALSATVEIIQGNGSRGRQILLNTYF